MVAPTPAPLVRRQIWCEFALLPTGIGAGVLVTIDGDRITAIEVSQAPPTAEIRLAGLTLPGFANSHSHAFHRALRGRTHSGRGDFWTWREQMYAVAARLTPHTYLELARATFAEMVLAGFTCVGEFHYVHHQPDGTPYDDPNAMGSALIAAAAQAGLRLTLLDTCYLRGGAGVGLSDGQQRFSDGTAQRWAERVALLADAEADVLGPMTRIGAAIHSVRAVDAASIATVASFATERAMPLHAHVSEQPSENEQVSVEHDATPTEVLARNGALSSRFTAVHATHLTDADVGRYGRYGCTCCFCPTTERDLADGIGPSAELRDSGVALSIGSDQHAVIDPFEELRAIEMDERLRSLRRGTHRAEELIAAGTVNGYRSLGWDDGGEIRVGGLADLTTVALDGVRVAGWTADSLLDTIVFAASAGDVSDVMVGGCTVVRDGVHLGLDVAAELRRSIDAVTVALGTGPEQP
jgi:formiminoglutamate deiminase